MNRPSELGGVLHDGRLREENALSSRLLSLERALESSVGEVREIKEVELIGIGLQGLCHGSADSWLTSDRGHTLALTR